MSELEAVEARIWSLLEPYRSELESATIYGMPSLRWPGAKAHDYFAAVRTGKSYVSLYLLVADTYPDALAGTSDALLKRRSGKAAFTFPRLDDDMARDLEQLVGTLVRALSGGSRRGLTWRQLGTAAIASTSTRTSGRASARTNMAVIAVGSCPTPSGRRRSPRRDRLPPRG